MLTEELALPHKVGDTFRVRLTVQERQSDTDPWLPMNLTDFDVVFGVGSAYGRGTAKKYRSVDDTPYVEIESALDGTILIDVPPAETRHWWEGTEVFSLYEVTLICSDTGDRMTVLEGPLVLRPEVVRDPHTG